MVDEVNDLILPGAFTRTLASRPVKTIWHHGWKDPVGVVTAVEEWPPGDPRFAELDDFPDWPAEAGALVASVAYNMHTQQGRDAYWQVKQWHEHKQAAFSIGYSVPAASATRRSDGVRVIHDLDLFEVSPVLHGAHPMTRSLEVKSNPATAGLEYKSTKAPVIELGPETLAGIKVAGLVVKAADTGRVLMIQRALVDDDPAAGTWEWPGGHLEDGEDALAAALREWHEETGSTLPGTATVVGSWTAPNGIYRGYITIVPTEDSLRINVPHDQRRVPNPDDPDGKLTEVTAWWPITALPDMPALRDACRNTPWSLLAEATLPAAAPADSEPSAAASEFAAKVMATYQAMNGQGAESKGLHPFQQSAESNAGNCTCGMARESAVHPHTFTKSLGSPQCVCSRPATDPIHTDTTEVKSAHQAVAAARAGLENKSIPPTSARAIVAEAKSRPTPAPEASVTTPQPMPESYEQLRSRISDSVRELLGGDDQTWACVESTYPDRVIVSVYSEGPGPSNATFSVPYKATASAIILGTPEPVELVTVVVPLGSSDRREATGGEDIDARVVQPTVDALTDATARISSTTAQPEQLEEVRETVQRLIAALSTKGLEVTPKADQPKPQPSATVPDGLALWDEFTFDEDDTDAPSDPSDAGAADDTEDPAQAPENTPRKEPEQKGLVLLDIAEVEAALAAMQG
ncbi:NUDIX domain-containing protein [Streptomyces sp. NPDC088732]|uniref:NUDIX domain-containing protein n=1 Tax=Streptomyces sp. NPDC088732 TaxID=3365879 RepID=UPI00381F0209